MRLLIFGATGATGQVLVRLALQAGHHVTAFVRDPGRLAIDNPLLGYVVGDVMQPSSIALAMPGQDAVLCALGTMTEIRADRPRRQPGVPVCSVGTRNILEAMSKHACRRIVVESSAGVGESRRTGRFGAAMLVRMALRPIMEDKELQETAVRTSAADWTVVRPVKLTNGPARGQTQAGESLGWNVFSTISRADTAAFMLAAVSDPGTSRKALTIRT